MKPHPCIRKTIKWGGAAATALLVVACSVSLLWQAEWHSVSKQNFEFGFCEISFSHGDGGRPFGPGWYFCRVAPIFSWRRDWRTLSDGWIVSIPLWIPLLIVGVGTIAAWRLDILARRARGRQRLCPKCNYDRAGIAIDAKCPECGSAAP